MQKKWVIGITAVTLAAATAIGSTLAYFTATTQKMTNNFTVAAPNGITGQLREPQWDGFDFNQYVVDKASSRDPIGTDVLTGHEKDTAIGINQAKDVLPGDMVLKDPTLMNTTNWTFDQGKSTGQLADGKVDVPVYMAMKVTYSDKFDATNVIFKYKDNTGVLQDGMNPGWVPYKAIDSKTEIYVWYGSKDGKTPDSAPAAISSGAKTAALFDSVEINPLIDTDKTTNTTTLQDFNIVLKGSAIQAKNVPANEISSRLAGLL